MIIAAVTAAAAAWPWALMAAAWQWQHGFTMAQVTTITMAEYMSDGRTSGKTRWQSGLAIVGYYHGGRDGCHGNLSMLLPWNECTPAMAAVKNCQAITV